MANSTTEARAAVNTGLEPHAYEQIAQLLGGALADNYVLLVKTQNFHWNVTGMHFLQLHQLFKQHYDQLAAAADELAEQMRKLGHLAPGSMKQFLKLATLKEAEGSPRSEKEMLQMLLADHEACCQSLRQHIEAVEELGDAATADMLTELLQGHMDMAWQIRAHLG